MSYCRWSSDKGQCDLYCYEDVNGGWTTHVAARRRVAAPDTLIDPYSLEGLMLIQEGNHDEWVKVRDVWDEFLEKAAVNFVVSPHAGKTYNDSTLLEFRARIVELSKDPGLNVPEWLLGVIDDEINTRPTEDE